MGSQAEISRFPYSGLPVSILPECRFRRARIFIKVHFCTLKHLCLHFEPFFLPYQNNIPNVNIDFSNHDAYPAINFQKTIPLSRLSKKRYRLIRQSFFSSFSFTQTLWLFLIFIPHTQTFSYKKYNNLNPM